MEELVGEKEWCDRCGRKLKNHKRRLVGLGRVCEKKEKDRIKAEIEAVGFDGVIQKRGVQMALKIDREELITGD